MYKCSYTAYFYNHIEGQQDLDHVEIKISTDYTVATIQLHSITKNNITTPSVYIRML